MFIVALGYWQTSGEYAGKVNTAVAQAESAPLALKFANVLKETVNSSVIEISIILGPKVQWQWTRESGEWVEETS